MYFRVEVAVRPEYVDPAADLFLRRIELAYPEIHRRIRWGRMLQVYWLDLNYPREKLIPAINEVFMDPVMSWLLTGNLIPSAGGKHGSIQDLMESAPNRPGKFWALEKRFRPGVTDNVGRSTIEAFDILLGQSEQPSSAASGLMFLMEGPKLTEEDLNRVACDVFSNELNESWTILDEIELSGSGRFHSGLVKRQLPRVNLKGSGEIETYQLDRMSDEQLEKLSEDKLWALNLAEMKAVQTYFRGRNEKERRRAVGLELPTDVELEIIAQSWSEHCKHKIFNAKINYRDARAGVIQERIPTQVNGLFKETIARTTAELSRPWLLSVFHDNAGIIAFDSQHAICMKVETHNSPSALDPYGGSLTGIVGVNRDILGCGRGAKPIFNTNVFCLAQPNYSQTLPDGLLHPRRILDGVRRGVEHGGNKSGIPTVNGALVFDQRYLGKPLIYVGTGGIMPQVSAEQRCDSKEIRSGDHILMVGGRVGKDGIHGATFSSLALNENSPASAVQLGDPITQKRMSDFLLEARDLGLFRTLTDNGAGGLSSSVGELADRAGGARIDLNKVLTKYPGLKPYEIVISESQERMTVVVPPDMVDSFVELAGRRSVEVCDIGEFNQSGSFDLYFDKTPVGSIQLEFLHNGLPRMELSAEWKNHFTTPSNVESSFQSEGGATLLKLLGRPNVCSKEWLIRQYDHEVQGTSAIKPLHTVGAGTPREKSGPNDGSVVKPLADSWEGVAVGCGINPKFSDVDPYLMAQSAVDEAVRNILCVGSDFGGPESVVALVDNFCWPDPVDDPILTAALVRACYGIRDAALALSAPFISGKDSMKNDFHYWSNGQKKKISVPPTLLITAVGKVSDVRRGKTADFKSPNDQIYLLGGSQFGLIGSELHSMRVENLKERGGNEKQVVLPVNSVTQGAPQDEILKIPRPNWDLANRVYKWIGRITGRKQGLMKSIHDISEGGLLVALSESLLARNLGATVHFPALIDGLQRDPWEFGFGEGFHSFVVSVGEADSLAVEEEWMQLEVPFLRLGTVTASGILDVKWTSERGEDKWSVQTQRLRNAWSRREFWE